MTRPHGPPGDAAPGWDQVSSPLLGAGEQSQWSTLWDKDPFDHGLGSLARRLPQRLDVDPDQADRGLAQLVLTVVDLLRQLMERQALRRLEGGSLTEDQVEALGQAFMKMEARMEDLKMVFGLEDADLNLDLGPLGDLL